MSDFSDQQIHDWAERHDIHGTPTDLRAMFEDAASMRPEFIPDFETSLKQVCAHLKQQGKTYIEIAFDPKTKEVAHSFTPTPA